jgi:hypothetical protein
VEPTLRTSMLYVRVAPLATGSGLSVLDTVRSGRSGVGVGVFVGVGVDVLVGVGVFVAVGVTVAVGVAVAVAVAVGVLVAVGVFVGVDVAVGVAVAVGVLVDVAVGVFVGVGVAVFVGVGVAVLVGVGVAVLVGVGVGVFVAVGVAVAVGVVVAVGVGVLVGVAVGVFVGVGVAVAVGVLVGVGVGVGARTVVVIVTELFASSYSTITASGSTVAVLETTVSTPVDTVPVMVIVAKAAAPVPNVPKSQSSVPPVVGPTTTHEPRVVLKLECVKPESGTSTKRTAPVLAEPTLRTSMV